MNSQGAWPKSSSARVCQPRWGCVRSPMEDFLPPQDWTSCSDLPPPAAPPPLLLSDSSWTEEQLRRVDTLQEERGGLLM